jgi:hypothetical protein
MKIVTAEKKLNRSFYLAVISAVALTCGEKSLAQTNDLVGTNSVAPNSSTNVVNLGNVTVVGQLDQARSQIVPNLGATAYTHTSEQIQSQSQGNNAPINQIVLRSPGVAQDSAANGDLHVRGEHANLQYRINDVLLPEGITGFGLELDPRFIDSLQLITGSLPAQYGFRTAGVVDIQTKSGAFQNGGTAEIYGGSYDTIRPSFEYGGSSSNLNYFVDGSFDHNDLGIENPTASHHAIHDITDQGKMFSYLSYILDDTSRVTVMLSASYSQFEVPDSPGLPAGMAPGGAFYGTPGAFNSVNLNENQNEQNYYGVVTYQKSAGKLDYQASVLGRNSDVHFIPDQVGDLYFNGVASDVNRNLYSGGLQGDASYELNDTHTLRGGVMFLGEGVSADSTTTVFDLDPVTQNPTSGPIPITDNDTLRGFFSGLYLQDEWKVLEKFTINYGARFDIFNSSFDNEMQFSPRINFIYTPTDKTTFHAGYARYFTPPPVENVPGNTVSQFDNTSNESDTDLDSHAKAERAHYFDAGVTQKLLPGLQVGVDAYYKRAKNQLDDGLFGQTLILSAFNYDKGEVYGTEFTASYDKGGFSTYANVSLGRAYGETVKSAQFLFDADDLAYIQNHWVHLDHDQNVSGSFGAAYKWNESRRNSTRIYVDAIYGSGLRTDTTVPNGGTVPAYYSINVGAEQSFKICKKQVLKARVDVVNVTDNKYELRDGSGIGVNAAQYGERLGFFGSLSYVF